MPDTPIKTIYLLLCTGSWAKLYSCTNPPGHPTLVYHQVNVGGRTSQFARELSRLLAAARRTGRYDALAVIASGDFLSAFDLHLDEVCRGSLIGTTLLTHGQLSNQDLTNHVRQLLASLKT